MQLGAPLGKALTPWGQCPTFDADDRPGYVIVLDSHDNYHYMRVDSIQFQKLG